MADFIYTLDKHIPIVEVVLEGPLRRITSRFVLDTGCGLSIVDTPQLQVMGYSRDQHAVGPYKTTSAVGVEHGYRLHLQAIELFGMRFENIEVAALDLPRKYNVHGLIGMNILSAFDWCLHPSRAVISVK